MDASEELLCLARTAFVKTHTTESIYVAMRDCFPSQTVYLMAGERSLKLAEFTVQDETEAAELKQAVVTLADAVKALVDREETHRKRYAETVSTWVTERPAKKAKTEAQAEAGESQKMEAECAGTP